MTTYLRQLMEYIGEKCGTMTNQELVQRLMEIGVIDFRMCKVLAVREHVWAALKKGEKKTNAMWDAAQHFCCTYEYVRKCMYYYTDVNLNQ